MLLLGLGDRPGTVDPLILLLGALIVEAILGRFTALSRLPGHPISIISATVGWLEQKLNRPNRSNMDRAIRGGVVAIFVLAFCLAVGGFVAWLTVNRAWGWIIEFALLVTLLGQGWAMHNLRRISRHLQRNQTDDASKIVAEIVPGETSPGDEHAVARMSVEWTVEQFSRAAVGPAIWYALFGFPGIMIYTGLQATSDIIGGRTDRYRAFGFTAGRLYDVLQLFPARLAGLFVVLAAAFVPTARPGIATKTMLRDAGRHYSVNRGWPLAALAGALELALGGPRTVDGHRVDSPWLGDGRARTTTRDIRRAAYLIGVAGLINVCWVAALAVVRAG